MAAAGLDPQLLEERLRAAFPPGEHLAVASDHRNAAFGKLQRNVALARGGEHVGQRALSLRAGRIRRVTELLTADPGFLALLHGFDLAGCDDAVGGRGRGGGGLPAEEARSEVALTGGVLCRVSEE